MNSPRILAVMIVNVKTGNTARLGSRKEIIQSALKVKYLIDKEEERSQNQKKRAGAWKSTN
jgi:predicted Holliday junction resolvase-like endonuclease